MPELEAVLRRKALAKTVVPAPDKDFVLLQQGFQFRRHGNRIQGVGNDDVLQVPEALQETGPHLGDALLELDTVILVRPPPALSPVVINIEIRLADLPFPAHFQGAAPGMGVCDRFVVLRKVHS